MRRVIHLIGPGGAGKTTTGAALADRLNVPFVDLDAEFASSLGDVSAYIDTYGYEAYAAENVSLYSTLTTLAEPFRVVALSSGFMTRTRANCIQAIPVCVKRSHRTS